MLKSLSHLSQLRSFQNMPDGAKKFVFFSEGETGYVHMAAIAKTLLAQGHDVCWVTSSDEDSMLEVKHDKLHSFDIGSGISRIIFFTSLKCNLLITTTPGLDQNQIKRSIHNPYYVYVHHSPVSHHMVYRPKAFSAFDAIMCVGPHHQQELLEEEEVFASPARKKLQHGYHRLDDLIAKASNQNNSINNPLKVLIAPSWGADGLIEGGYAGQMIYSLEKAGFAVALRPHPRTQEFAADSIFKLKQEFPALIVDDGICDTSSILDCDLMISDWSGVAFEYAFSRLRPVLYVNTPKKVNNPNHRDFKTEPFEVSIREKIGLILETSELSKTGETAQKMIAERHHWETNITTARSECIFNLGRSASVAADQLVALAVLENR